MHQQLNIYIVALMSCPKREKDNFIKNVFIVLSFLNLI